MDSSFVACGTPTVWCSALPKCIDATEVLAGGMETAGVAGDELTGTAAMVRIPAQLAAGGFIGAGTAPCERIVF